MTESKAIALVVDSSLAPTTAGLLRESFESLFAQADQWREKALAVQITDASQIAEMKIAREMRLELRRIRTTADKKRKELKEESLRTGRAIDGIYNILEAAIVPIEKHLQAQEDWIEEQANKKKAEVVAERRRLLTPFVVDVNAYVLGDMADDAFAIMLDSHRRAHEARVEADRRAAEEKAARDKAEAQKREAERAELERLRQERAAADAERKKLEDEARAERERAAEAERVAAGLRAAQAARERREREAEEQRRRQEEADAARKAAAPDHERIVDWLQRIALEPAPEVSTPLGVEIRDEMQRRIAKFMDEARFWIDVRMKAN